MNFFRNPKRPGGNNPTPRRWLWLALALLLTALVILPSISSAQLSSYRLDIRKASVEEGLFSVYFTLLGSTQEAIKKVDVSTVTLLSEDADKEISWSEPELKLLADTKKSVAVMFVIANHRSFNEKNSKARGAAQEFLGRMRDIDLAGVVYYDNKSRDLPFTPNTKALADQLDSVKDSDEPSPRILAALGNGVRRFGKELDQQSIDLRYMVIISDGSGAWAGFSDETVIDKKIDRLAKGFKEKNIIPLVIGHAPLLGDDEPGINNMLKPLAARSGGTFRYAEDPESVFAAVDAAYNEIYGSHVLTFKSGQLSAGESHKLRLAATVEAQKLKSNPVSLFVPESGPDWTLIAIGGGACFLLLFAGIGLVVVIVIVRRRKAAKEEEEYYEQDYYEQQQPEAAGGGGGGMVQEEYDDEPPASYFAKLTARSGPVHGRRFYITEESTTIGRGDGNSIIIHDQTVSRKHAGIRIKEGKRYELHDFGAASGVFINERRVSTQFLKNKDVIKLGETELVFTLE